MNINVVLQSVELMKKAKKIIKERKGKDFYKINTYVEKEIFEKENYMTNDAMRTQAGLINRFTGN